MIGIDSRKTARIIHASSNYFFKQKYGRFFLLSLCLSGIIHLVLVSSVSTLTKNIDLPQETVMQLVELPPEVMIPAPPTPLPEPVIPESVLEQPVAYLDFPETIPPQPVPEIMPEAVGPVYKKFPVTFIPVRDAMPRYSYIPPKPRLPIRLARERVDALTVVEFDLTSEVTVSSGYPELDKLALEWARDIKMVPAMSQGEPTEVRIAIPLRWVAR